MATSRQPAFLNFAAYLAEELGNDSRLLPHLTRKILLYISSDRDLNNFKRHKISKRVDSWRSDGPDYLKFPYSVPAYAPDQHHGDWILDLLSYAKFPAISKRDECHILDFSEAGYVVLKSGRPVPYEGRLSRLAELGSRSRDDWREWLIDLDENHSVQQNLDVESRPDIARFRFIFLRKLKSLTKEEIMRLFVSYNLSPHYYDMAIVDDGFSWLGSSTSFHLDRLPSFDVWYVLPMRLPQSQEQFKEAGLNIYLHTDNIAFRRTNLYLFRRPMSIYFRYERASGKTTMIVQHPIMEELQPRFLESFENIDKLHYLDNPFGIHGVGVSYVLKEWKRSMMAFEGELIEIEQDILRFDPGMGYTNLTKEIHEYLATAHRVTTEISHLSSVLQSLREKHEDFCRKVLGFDPFQDPGKFVQFNDFLSEALHKVNAWHILLDELTKRADTTAGLLFNRLTAGLGVESRRDNVRMKIIAFFTMVYLPGSFVSSIFGWSIINFSIDPTTNQQSVVVGEQWKIYVKATVSLTLATIGAFYLFQTVEQNTKKARKGALGALLTWEGVKNLVKRCFNPRRHFVEKDNSTAA